MKKKKENKKLKILLPIVIIVAVSSVLLFTGAFGNPLGDVTVHQLIEDTNIKIVDIADYSYNQGDVEVIIKSIDIGDKYTVLNYDMSEITAYSFIRGVQLLQDGQPLEYKTARTTSRKGCAIAFQSIQSFESLEIWIIKIENIEKKELSYPLSFENNAASFDIELFGQSGSVTIILDDTSCKIETSGIDEYRQDQDFDLPIPSIEHFLVRDGKIDEGPFNANNPPEILLIVYDEVIYSDEVIVIPVS